MIDRKLIPAFFAFMMMMGSLSGQFAGGTGSEEDPYLVETAQHLDNVRYYSDSYFRQIADIDLDIEPWNSGEGWEPIGNREFPFVGLYNGNNFVISNLYINRPSFIHVGLFGYVEDATLLSLEISSIDLVGFNYAGGLVGLCRNTEIQRIKITNVNISGASTAGGLAGKSIQSHITFSSCVIANQSIMASDIAGGLVGFADTSFVYRCNTKRINDVYGGIITSGVAGGLIGSLSGSEVIKSFSKDFYISGSAHSGGLVGAMSHQSEIEECFSTGTVFAGDNAGGLVGWMKDSNSIRNSYSYALSTISYAGQSCGGLVGAMNGLVEDSYSTGLVSGNPASSLGGLIGVVHIGSSIENSYWDIESSGQYNSAGGDPLEFFEFVFEDNLNDWDFRYVWMIPEHNPYIRRHYPIHHWRAKPEEFNSFGNWHVKLLNGRNWYWESFPKMTEIPSERHLDYIANHERLIGPALFDQALAKFPHYDPFTAFYDEQEFMWNYLDLWLGDMDQTSGYKIRMWESCPHYLLVSGTRVDEETTITLYQNTEEEEIVNWVGYFVLESQYVFDAFGHYLDSIKSIRAEDWSITYHGGAWMGNLSRALLHYGKMYEITLRIGEQTITDFSWNIPETHLLCSGHPVPEYFQFYDQAVYHSFFIENIEDDENINEIAVFAGETCIGASVFEGEYPIELQAYFTPDNINDEISFELHSNQRGSNRRFNTAEIKDKETGEYVSGAIRPSKGKYSIVRLGSTENQEHSEEVEPTITTLPNYPNTFSASGISRINGTAISFVAAEDMRIKVSVYNIKGQLVSVLFEGDVTSGKHTVHWRGVDDENKELSSGVYFYRIETPEKSITRKMMLIK